MVAQDTRLAPQSTRRPASIQARAYAEASNYIVSPLSGELGSNDWQVLHLQGHGYDVDLSAGQHGTCTCPDFQHRGTERACKHIWITRYHVQAEAMVAPAPAGVGEPVELDDTAKRHAQARAERELWD